MPGKEAQRKELASILAEFQDIEEGNVSCVIRYAAHEYIVFLDADNEVDFETSASYDQKWATRRPGIDKTYNRIEEIEHSPALPYLSPQVQHAVGRLLGGSLVAELDGNEDLAKKSLLSTEDYFRKRTAEVSRKWLLLGAMAAMALAFLRWNWFFRREYILFGCLGALFSIICKTGKLEYDCQAGLFLNVLEILSRFLAAAISAYFAEQLFQMDLLFSALKSMEDSSSVLSLICFISGFSERLVPSLVSHFEAAEEKERIET